ncbi:MAG: PKD domain-containing protein [Halobacterium sp.]
MVVVLLTLTGAALVSGTSLVQGDENATLQMEEIEDGDVASSTIGEIGHVTVNQTSRSEWFTLDLQNNYDSPVVIMKPVGPTGSHPAHVRIRDVQSGSFQYKIEEWSSTDGPHQSVRISYFVVESGTHELADGMTLEAGTVNTDHNFSSVEFASSFDTRPVVFSQSQTHNGNQYIVTRNNNVTTSSFLTRVQEEEGADGNHTIETVGYVAVEPGTGTNQDTPFEVGRTDPVVEEAGYTIDFARTYDSSVEFVADMQTQNGGNTAEPRLDSLTGDSATVFIEEETTADSETDHPGSEAIGYLTFDAAGTLTSQTSNEKPTAEFTHSPTEPTAGEDVTLDASGSSDSDGTVAEYRWDVDNDGTADLLGQRIDHQFSEEGVYTVSLTVVDDDGSSSTTERQITVGAAQTTTQATTQTTTQTGCQPADDGTMVQAVQLHTDDPNIETGDPGQISGAIAADISNNCPIKVQLTLEVPNGMRIEGGNDIRSGGGGLVTSTFTVEPGESKSISADVYSADAGEKVVKSSITYYPVDNQDMARQQDTGTLTFDVAPQSTTATPTEETSTATATPTTAEQTSQTEQDSDGDGVPDEDDYAPDDPNVQVKSDLQEDTSSESISVPGFGLLHGVTAAMLAGLVAHRRFS